MPVSEPRKLTVWFVRHGERTDFVDPNWRYTTTTPYDPPLTELGAKQATKTGYYLRDLAQENFDSFVRPHSKTRYLLYASPFLRCIQTAEGIIRGIGTSRYSEIVGGIRLEPALSEWMSEEYFTEQIPDSLISSCKEACLVNRVPLELAYKPQLNHLPEFPETLDQLAARFRDFLERTVQQLEQDTPENEPFPTVILVTHGAGVNSLLEACFKERTLVEVNYCSLSRAHLNLKKKEEGWLVDKQATTIHLR
ncbi:phosphoglycerate mutase-like protein [Basidiobolus meristosporus CBS 931.73]|uniref:Phosphoglycerate mutase-like protein n=1 Tax=Basidiobolus meristosporus CBS 931.73 TaxID=1314790 RepID=A0A1Y1XEQ7_9FUNG|nr:phosphoglycerate mutase-like protein [Basidiobolus meristosporus CBS 931.73]ORX94743.1 phosphoglycerate mutase-like protein [Basidiobolus meristosporus CBS 931.73]|eukprot:ORX84261.1 phosphoglycerate mutase-like protein [Basidiobolus meristosporus CBS 931.73]